MSENPRRLSSVSSLINFTEERNQTLDVRDGTMTGGDLPLAALTTDDLKREEVDVKMVLVRVGICDAYPRGCLATTACPPIKSILQYGEELAATAPYWPVRQLAENPSSEDLRGTWRSMLAYYVQKQIAIPEEIVFEVDDDGDGPAEDALQYTNLNSSQVNTTADMSGNEDNLNNSFTQEKTSSAAESSVREAGNDFARELFAQPYGTLRKSSKNANDELALNYAVEAAPVQDSATDMRRNDESFTVTNKRKLKAGDREIGAIVESTNINGHSHYCIHFNGPVVEFEQLVAFLQQQAMNAPPIKKKKEENGEEKTADLYFCHPNQKKYCACVPLPLSKSKVGAPLKSEPIPTPEQFQAFTDKQKHKIVVRDDRKLKNLRTGITRGEVKSVKCENCEKERFVGV